MEIADIFVVNKSDRPEADQFVKNLRLMMAPAFTTHAEPIPVIMTVALQKEGIEELNLQINKLFSYQHDLSKKAWLLTERAWYLIEQRRMKELSKEDMQHTIQQQLQKGNFNLYKFIQGFS
jgi:LAO/AO transport system kinase